MPPKPGHVFDRNEEWAGLARFAANAYPGAMLGVVSGRRRQGKSFLLEALTTATGGLYCPAVEQTEVVSLRSFTTMLVRQGIPVARPLQDWDDAMALLLSAVTGQPRVVVIDEFPFLVKASPALLIAREPDLFRAGRWLYRVTEPLIAFYEVVMRPEWFRLEAGYADQV